MANYNYDESGNMSAYFVITFLVFILVPLTFSISPSKKVNLSGCQCQPCVEQRKRIEKREGGSLLNPKFSKKTLFVVSGWTLVAYMCYKVAGAKLDNKIYNPFEILGIKTDATEKEIKSHFKKLSKQYHPDKVKATVNQTIEDISNRFVELTKAYKALTDETIRRNWEQYGNPDGRQETSMGIALPRWVVEAQNNIWVLGFYGLVFGGALPAVVGRWWFGSRQKTKDGISARAAAAFFKTIKEDSRMDEVIGALGKSFQHEKPGVSLKAEEKAELDRLEKLISEQVGKPWEIVKSIVGVDENAKDSRRRSMILLYAHLLRLDINRPSLKDEQTQILLQTPVLLNALLSISVSRNWLVPTIFTMRFHSFVTQALLPHNSPIKQRLAQLPGIKTSEVSSENTFKADDLSDLVAELEQKGDGRATDVKKAVEKWGRLEIVDASFKVIGERIVTPSSIVYLMLKLRISPPGANGSSQRKEPDADTVKKYIKINEEKDNEFLLSRKDAEDVEEENSPGWAHAPYWPGNRRPGWWLVLADDKTARVVVPPMKITQVPYSNPNAEYDRDYRTYKLQFQAPNGPGLFTWKIYLVSDTFVGEEVSRALTLKIDDASALNADEQGDEDEISDPEEDSLAGQMAAMRGGSVKKTQRDEESDEESSTDDDQESDDSSDSDDD
ncbi:translocation protein sec63 [Moniliophthora roreri MCA 2997]|uniref:Translocation protein sec63 n=2 Tax=Moniliophthora roreri TaxID=221103 RepID=V2WLV4_MONRO|nr:translocation protein sec63 [Moniliophthora roreri MCA 2997]KAI3603629.1 translocation protein sec63 [Moniliophthora roreri]